MCYYLPIRQLEEAAYMVGVQGGDHISSQLNTLFLSLSSQAGSAGDSYNKHNNLAAYRQGRYDTPTRHLSFVSLYDHTTL